MKEQSLDSILVPVGLVVLGAYHVWLLYTILRHPSRTVIGLNAMSRHQWVISMTTDPMKNGVLAVQTIRNNIMASTLLATTAITLSSLIGIFASNDSDSASKLVYGNTGPLGNSIKRLSISVCFLIAFLCNVQSIRYYAHVSFLITAPALKGKNDFIEYVAKILNRGSLSWTLGLRAFYLSFPLVLWIYGPIPMFACCCLTSFILYFLDTTTQITRDLHTKSFKEREIDGAESV
ncbi:putative transmembrane protein [Senna tora]|uniref:Putative transmembrane protein n=1 Tax=Senna tora TaxID=362788 RepID=A0A834WEQ1_9FABA|nr:putative transmembrane protein [Senna tora]